MASNQFRYLALVYPVPTARIPTLRICKTHKYGFGLRSSLFSNWGGDRGETTIPVVKLGYFGNQSEGYARPVDRKNNLTTHFP